MDIKRLIENRLTKGFTFSKTWLMDLPNPFKRKVEDKPEDMVCPVCGYYCLGKGGVGCIDKPFYIKKDTD